MRRIPFIPWAFALAAAACDSSTTPPVPPKPPVPARIDVVSGDAQMAVVGTELPQPLGVRVLDEVGKPVPGQAVEFRVVAGGGSVSAASAQTDANGEARGRWTLGTVAGDTQRVEARVGQGTAAAAVFSAVGGPGAPVRASLAPASLSFIVVGERIPLAVAAYDAYGNPVPDVPASVVSRDGAVVRLDSGAVAVSAGLGTTRIVAILPGGAADSIPAVVQQAVLVSLRIPGPPGFPEATEKMLEGASRKFGVRAETADGRTIYDLVVAWRSEDESVATVSAAGVVTARAAGTTRIVARSGTLEATRDLMVLEPIDAVAVAAGGRHACSLNASGRAYCWGANDFLQLGNPAPTPTGTSPCTRGPCSREPVLVNTGVRFVSLAAGFSHTCGLTAAGEAWCWGYGTGVEPRRMDGVPALASLTARGICGLTAEGEAICWPSTSPTTPGIPVSVSSLRFSSFSTTGSYYCGVALDRVGYCWGDNRRGQLGTGDTVARAQPTQIAGGLRWSRIETGYDLACGIATDDRVYCWSGPQTSTGPAYGLTPTLVVGDRTVTQLSVGDEHACAVDATG
ncbi:MAG TPA: Ig-like domain-containing protein, partial [Longimicrobium sp.]|nr:Ig-like domain-containing protein [Longimicrobium sp.]